MKVAILQAGISGFFPRYYSSLFSAIEKHGDEVRLYVPNSKKNKKASLSNKILWGSRLNWHIHYCLYYLTGIQDIYSFCDTLILIYKLKKYRPDVIHLNVINDKILNIPILIRFVNSQRIPVVWTMHDCRAFTGQCSYFDDLNCNKWQKGCIGCRYCESKFNNTNITWKIRKQWLSNIHDLVIVTPSKWLAAFVGESFLKDKFLKIIYNGVDTELFSQKVSIDVRTKYNIRKEKIILGCAVNWEPRKGLIFFEHLSFMLPEDYKIVLIGDIQEEKKQSLTQKGIMCIGRTNTIDELIAWYQAASVFCNPTMADNFPTTNIEALASGTPVVTFNTGGSPEAIDKNTGIVVNKGDEAALYEAILNVAEHRGFYSSQKCIARSMLFSNDQYNKYVDLYYEVCHL